MIVTVIIPTYNAEKILPMTIKSITNQTFSGDIEIIIIDDFSRDRTVQVATELGCRVIVLPKNTGGPNTGRNVGLNEAKGEYICFLDQDDEFLPDKIETQIKIGSPISFTDTSLFYTKTGQNFINGRNDGKIIQYKINDAFKFVLKKDKKKCSVMLSTLMIHKSLKNILFEEKFGMVDYDYQLRLLENNLATRISNPLTRRNIDETNLSLNIGYGFNDYNVSKEYYLKYSKNYPIETKIGQKHLDGTMARYFYRIGDMKKSRHFLKSANKSWKTLAYFITSFFMSGFVNKHFRVFGT